jgi:hypothetical protein
VSDDYDWPMYTLRFLIIAVLMRKEKRRRRNGERWKLHFMIRDANLRSMDERFGRRRSKTNMK